MYHCEGTGTLFQIGYSGMLDNYANTTLGSTPPCATLATLVALNQNFHKMAHHVAHKNNTKIFSQFLLRIALFLTK